MIKYTFAPCQPSANVQLLARGPAAMRKLAIILFVLLGLASLAASDSDHPESQSLKRRAPSDAAVEQG